MKYQKRDLAMTSLGANSFIRNAGGSGTASVGALRPTTCWGGECAGSGSSVAGERVVAGGCQAAGSASETRARARRRSLAQELCPSSKRRVKSSHLEQLHATAGHVRHLGRRVGSFDC